MRIVQVIDSLEVGGAEKMAVNYANALASKIEFSGLISTRAEGNLKYQLSDKVSYLFLNRKGLIDFRAILKFKKYCQDNNIEYIHSHSTSYFISLLVKFIHPKIKIIWHDHNGLSEFISYKETIILQMASFFFKGILVVNNNLKVWAENKLNCKRIVYLPNFTNHNKFINSETILKGDDGKRILCLANLREQKNHFLLLEIAEKLKKTNPDWTFHLVGKDFEDDYSKQLKKTIKIKNLENHVFIYGSKNDIENIIDQSDIAVLTSMSEGLPVALIEYGLSKKPVISTNVGEIPNIINNEYNGFLINNFDSNTFFNRLCYLINDSNRIRFGNELYKTINENHSDKKIIHNYLNWIITL